MISSVQQLSLLSGKRLLLAIVGIFLLSSMAHAAQITLAWDKVSGTTVAGYKLYYGTQSSTYTTTVNAGNTSQYTISNLPSDTTYYFAAKTYDSSGNESCYSNEVTAKIPTVNAPAPPTGDPAQETPPGGSTPGDDIGGNTGGDTGGNGTVKFWLEAEDGDIAAPMEIAGSDQASAEGFIWTPNGAGNNMIEVQASGVGSVEHHLDVSQAGNYMIWGRVLSPTSEDDSYFISVDDGPYDRWDTQVSPDWTWNAVGSQSSDGPLVFYLAEGSHAISLLQCEDGTKIDRLLVTNDVAYIPEGLGEAIDEPDSGDSSLTGPEQTQSGSGGGSAGCFLGVHDVTWN